MSKKGFIRVKIDASLKDKAEKILAASSVSVPDAIIQFYSQIVQQGKYPLDGAFTVAATQSVMNAEWLGWTKENIERGASSQEIFEILHKNNFSLLEIKNAMGDYLPAIAEFTNELQRMTGILPGVDYKRLSNVRITDTSRSGARKVADPKLQLYVLEHFLNDAECDELSALILESLRPSTISDPNRAEDYYDANLRTSSTCDLSHIGNDIVTRIDQRIADCIGINLSYSEAIQAQKYLEGQQFTPHTDYFEPGTPEYTKHAGQSGNRTWTFMVYLNNTAKGGATRFTDIGQVFYPQKGTAVIWNNRNEDGTVNPHSIHTGERVVEGEKIIITKWFREKGKGAMLIE